MSWYKLSILFVFVFLFPLSVFAQVEINEIYPAPKDGEYEWVELYNNSDVAVQTDQLILKDATGKAMTLKSASIPPQGYEIATSSALLNNKDETVFLTTKAGNVIESVFYGIQFDSETSYSKCAGNFIVSSITKLTTNSCSLPTETPSPTSITPSPAPPTTTSSASIDNIRINEAMVAPNTGEKEWIELANLNDFEVNLTDWYIDSHKFTISIPAKGYGVIEMNSSLFKNSGDEISLYDSSKNTKDLMQYSASTKGYSLGLSSENSYCVQLPSRGIANSPCTSASSASATSNSESSKNTSSTTKASSSSNNPKPLAHLYEGIITMPLINTDSSEPEKEYRVSGYKNERQPAIDTAIKYGPLVGTSLSLLAFGIVIVKMKRYLYEKDALMALALVTAVGINGYYFLSLFTA